MMAFGKKKPTAEQKLLQMIEASQGGAALAGKSQKKVVEKQNILALLKTFNMVLMIGSVGAAVFLFNEIADGAKLATQKIKFKTPQDVVARSAEASASVPAVESYLDTMKPRNIFMPYEEKGKTATATAAPDSSIRQKTAKLRLVGVSWFDSVDTASVMIEDTEKQETYFLKKNEKMGDIIIKTIYADSALLGYENEEMILKYDKPQM